MHDVVKKKIKKCVSPLAYHRNVIHQNFIHMKDTFARLHRV